ncbi:MAG: hypothetical protein ACTSQE_15770, partial [Candidatus Heimdallarchaeaceae archaeon]
MFSYETPELRKTMGKAREILKDSYQYLERIVIRKKIKTGSPAWDIVCFLTSVQISNQEEKFNSWLDFWGKHSRVRKYQNLNYEAPISYFPFYNEERNRDIFNRLLEIVSSDSSSSSSEQNWNLYLS